MNEENAKPYLSDAIDYDADIAPHRFIKIYAGVGSGKSTFIDNIAKGDVIEHQDHSKVKKQYVLLITSRRAKVDEQLNCETVVYDHAVGLFDFIPSVFVLIRTLRAKEREEVLQDLCRIVGISSADKNRQQLSTLLKRFGFRMEAENRSNKKNRPTKIVPMESKG